MKNKILIIALLFTFGYSFGQQDITWNDLSKVRFVEKYFPKYKGTYLSPIFSDSVKLLEGQKVSITGFYLDVDPDQKIFILSKGPLSSCFFCGSGGPETAMELEVKPNKKFKTDDIVKATGILKLNANDVEHFNYILTDCKLEVVE